ncbi:MAG TPA: hypothetical protein VGD56_00950, partial [Gemmatirosa sp.]
MRPAHLRPLAALCGAILTADTALAQPRLAQATRSPPPPAARPGDFDYLLGDWRFTGVSKRWGRLRGAWSAVRLATG